MTDLTHTLTAVEADYLAECEDRIERGLQTFVEVGTALAMIRDNKLYRAQHQTFAGYCEQRWGFTDRRARQIIEAAEIGTMVPVENERQARALAGVPEAERAEVWTKANESTGGKPTAAAIREAFQPSHPETPARRDPEQIPPGTSAVATPGGPAVDQPSATAEAAGQLERPVVRGDREREAPTGSEEPVGAAETAVEGPFPSTEADGEGSSFGPVVPAAAPAPAEEGPAGAGVNPSDLVNKVLDALVPDDNPHREWQRKYMGVLLDARKVMRPGIEQAADSLDDQLADELLRLAEDIGRFAVDVLKARKERYGDNVIPLRGVS